MNKFMYSFIILISLITIADPAFCEQHEKAGTTAASFLKIGIGARQMGMGGAFCAVADDVNTINWNPAGLASVWQHEITLMHNEWFPGIETNFLAYCLPLGRYGSVGISMNALGAKPIDKTIEDSQGLYAGKDGTFNVSDNAFGISYGIQVISIASLGLNIKMLQQTNDDASAGGMAIDAGGLFKVSGDKFKAGFNVQNIGSAIAYDDNEFELPMNIKAGLASAVIPPLTLALDFNQPVDNYANINFGCEYKIKWIFAARFGYRHQLGAASTESIFGLHAGCGVRWRKLRIDYAFVPYGELKSAHQISFLIAFGGKKPEEAPKKPKKKKEKKKKEKKPKKEAEEAQDKQEDQKKETKEAIEKEKKVKDKEKVSLETRLYLIKQRIKKESIERGKKYYKQKRYRDAVEEFQKVLKIDPNHKESKKYIDKSNKKLQEFYGK